MLFLSLNKQSIHYMSLQPAGALRYRAVYVDQVTRDRALVIMISEYKQERAYFFCNRLSDIICDTPNGRLTLIDAQDFKAVAYMMGLEEDMDRFRAMIDFSAFTAKYFDPDEWRENHALTNKTIQEQIEHLKIKKGQDRLRQARHRAGLKDITEE